MIGTHRHILIWDVVRETFASGPSIYPRKPYRIGWKEKRELKHTFCSLYHKHWDEFDAPILTDIGKLNSDQRRTDTFR